MACVYEHIRSDKNEVFYIGIGNDTKRAYSLKNRNRHWKNIVKLNKFKFEIVILFINLTWEEACEKEKELIQKHGRSDLKKGPLCNLTDGGEGVLGLKTKEEVKRKLSELWKGKKPSAQCLEACIKKMTGSGNHNFGKPLPERQKEINRKAQLGKKHSSETIAKRVSKTTGLKRSKEFCDRMKESALLQSEVRRKRALEQWAKRKQEGFTNLKVK